MSKLRTAKKYIPILVLAFFGVLLLTMGFLNHYFFRTYTFDYGNYNFAFWDYSHFRISPMPTYPGNFLQDHFSFALMYFVPVYWLINWLTGTYTLILIQNLLIIVAAWYTFKLISLKSENKWIGIGVLVYYFTLLGRYTTVSCDTNIAVISACFIPVFIYYFEIRKYLISLFILILSLFSRENIPIWFMFIFAVLLIENRRDKKAVIFSLIGIFISITYFIILFKVIIPFNESVEKRYTLFNYSALGANPGDAMLFVIKHPVETFKLFFINHLNDPSYNGVKAEFYWVYLISGGFILFFRPKYLIWFIPIVAQKVLNDSFMRWGIATYYSVEVVTLLPLSVFLALASIKQSKIQNRLIIVVCVATLATTIYKLDVGHCKVPWTMTPSKEKFYDKRFWKSEFDEPKVYKLFSLIPANAKVSASDHLLPHLSQRQSIYLFPTVNDAEFVVFSVLDDYFMMSHYANETVRNKYFSDQQWKLIAKEFPVFLFEKIDSLNDVKQLAINSIKEITDTITCDFEHTDPGNGQILLSNGEKADLVNYLSTEKSLNGEHSIMLSPENPFSSSIKINDVDKISYLEISVWTYSKQNQCNIIAKDQKDFYLTSKEGDSADDSGWKRIVLGFWIPKSIDASNLHFSLWNSSSEPVYFDNLQIVKKYK